MTVVERLNRAFPWGVESGVRWAVLTLGCGVGLVGVWWEIAGRGVFSTQVGWLTAGIAVLMLTLYAHASLVIRGRRAVGERRAGLIDDGLASLVPLMVGETAGIDEFASGGMPVTDVVVVEGVGMFHVAGCQMTAGRAVSVLPRGTAIAGGLDPCGICALATSSASSAGR
jgi:hypothetical protein